MDSKRMLALKTEHLHHSTTVIKSSRMIMNAAKLARAISAHGNSLLKKDMHNLVAFAVTPAIISSDIENQDQLGREVLEKFFENRTVSNSPKNNFSFFKDVGAVVQTNIKGQVQHVRQIRNLLSRLLVVAKSRPDFSVNEAIGPLDPNGSLTTLSCKAQVVRLVMGMPVRKDTSVEGTGVHRNCIK